MKLTITVSQETAVVMLTVTQAEGEVRHKLLPHLCHTLLQPQEECGQRIQ